MPRLDLDLIEVVGVDGQREGRAEAGLLEGEAVPDEKAGLRVGRRHPARARGGRNQWRQRVARVHDERLQGAASPVSGVLDDTVEQLGADAPASAIGCDGNLREQGGGSVVERSTPASRAHDPVASRATQTGFSK